MVLFYDQKPEIGKDYQGKVKSIKDFGAFVEILPGVEGMVHISQLDIGRVENIHEFLSQGQELKVKVIDIESGSGRIRLSRKAVLLEEQGKTFDLDQEKDRRRDGGGKRPSGPGQGRKQNQPRKNRNPGSGKE
jgi:polyribonucleotide nucleotidyltransferase